VPGREPTGLSAHGLQFGLQSHLTVAPQSLVHTLARVLHLERGHVGVALGRRHPGVSKDLLHDADVNAVLDQQSRRRVPDDPMQLNF